MGELTRWKSAIALIAITVFLGSCARTLHEPPQQSSAAVIAELWQAPTDMANRDLFYGSGGPELVPPQGTYAFVSKKTTGKNPGYDVRDSLGRLWAVKLGEEAQTEVVVSRVLWAVGFPQPANYFVERWTMAGGDASDQPAGRFRAELASDQVVGEWSWYDNPFIGSRPFGGLLAINLLLNNWDLKTTNNKIYLRINSRGDRERVYVVRDVGGSLGRAHQPWFLRWIPFMRDRQGTKNDVDAFEAQPFIVGADKDGIEFSYRGLDQALAKALMPADLHWAAELLSRLSERQWQDAFRAGGYSAEHAGRYINKIREKIGQAATVGLQSSPARP